MEGPDEAEVTFQVVESGTQRGKRKLVSSDGFTFTLKRQNRGETVERCAIRNKTVTCPVTIQQRGTCFVQHKDHLHAARPDILRAVEIQKKVSFTSLMYFTIQINYSFFNKTMTRRKQLISHAQITLCSAQVSLHISQNGSNSC